MSLRKRIPMPSLVLATALALGACDSQSTDSLIGPADEPAIPTTPQPAFVFGGQDCDGTAQDLCIEAVVDQDGGTIWLGRSFLMIQPEAVDGAVTFRMEWTNDLDGDGTMDDMSLTATRADGQEVEIFRRVVMLGLEYEPRAVKNPRAVRLQEALPDGTFRDVPRSYGLPGLKVVVGWLEHFSQYVIASN